MFRNPGRHCEDSMVRKTEKHERPNNDAAQVIVDDPDAHGGEGSLAVQWARSVLGKIKQPSLLEAA